MNEHGHSNNEQPDNRTNEQQQLDNRQHKRQFWQGIAWGCIPLILFLVTTALVRFSQNYNGITYGIIGLIASVLAYIFVLIIALTYLSQPQRRFLGYGLLTMVLVAPIIGAIGCVVATRPL